MKEYRDYGTSKIMDLAEKNDINAVVELARRYYFGSTLVEKDISKSEFWIQYAKDLVNSNEKKIAEIENEVNCRKDEVDKNTTNSGEINNKRNTTEESNSSGGLKTAGIIDLIMIIPKVFLLDYLGYGGYIVPFIIISIIIDLFLIFK